MPDATLELARVLFELLASLMRRVFAISLSSVDNLTCEMLIGRGINQVKIVACQ